MGSARSARSSARQLLGLAFVAAIVAGCGDLSESDAEKKIRRYAREHYDAALGRCERVEAGKHANGVRLFRCRLPGPNTALERDLAVEGRPVDAKRWPKFVCFEVAGDGSYVDPAGYGYPDRVEPGSLDHRTPCGTAGGP